MFLSNQHYFSLRKSKCSDIFVILIAKGLQIEVHSKSVSMKPLICGKNHAITLKCHNSYDTNFT